MNIIQFEINLSAQTYYELGMPFIKNFKDENFPFISDQTWCIIRDNKGIIYAANNNGVIEYDGSSFRLHKIGDDIEIRSLAYDSENDKIYIGANSEFGYFEKTENGELKYICISDSFQDIQVKSTWKTYYTTHGIYFFISKNSVVKFDKNHITNINYNFNSEFRGFLLNDTIVVTDLENGFLIDAGNSLEKLNYGFEPTQQNIRAILPETDSSYIIFTTSNGLYRWITGGLKSGNNTFLHIDNPINEYLIDNLVYYAIKNNDSYLIATLSGGIVVLDKQLNLKIKLKKQNGLLTNGNYYLYNDLNSNVWVGNEKGISLININSPYRKYSELIGLNGTVSSIKKYDDILYIGTYDGLFYMKNNKINSFYSKEICITKLYSFKPENYINEVFIGASLRNIIQIFDTTKIESLENMYSCYEIITSKNSKNRLFFAHSNGLTAYDYEIVNEKIKLTEKFEYSEINYDVSNLCYDNYGNLWGGTFYDGIFVIVFNGNDDLKNFSIFKFDVENGLPSEVGNSVYFYDDKILIATRKGLFTTENTDFNDLNFSLDNSFGFNFEQDSISFYSLSFDNDKNVWFTTSKGLFKYSSITKELISEPFKNLKDIQKDNVIYIDNENITWIGMKDELFSYNENIKENYNIENKMLIRKVSTITDIIFNGNLIENDIFDIDSNYIKYLPKINYEDNSIVFEYSLPYYINSNLNVYSTFLQGYDKVWTDWSSKNERSFTNLPEGKYIFFVKAKNTYDIECDSAKFEFTIIPPWYRTPLALLIYLVIFIVSIFLTLNYRTKKILKSKKELEKIIEIRTSQIEQQKEEIKSQAYKLAIQTEELASQTEKLTLSNNELKHLSLVAQETDNSVVLLDKRGRFEWWNKGFTQLFSYRFEKYKNADFKTKQKMLRPDLQKEIKCYTKEKGTIRYTAHDIFENGQEVWYQTTINPVYDQNGEIFRYVAIDFDITKLKLAEIEINKQKEEIQMQAEKLRYINIELSKQRNKIEKQNMEMKDSILYAKRIQEAMLPLEIFIDAVLPENFILYKPRDIVSGDFYWFSHKNGKTIFAAADCTGHGIPGAFMSMLGIYALKEIINRTEIITSDGILNILREQIMIILHQRGKQGEATDGMDIALCVYNEKKQTLEYSGANNPMYLIRKNEINEYDLIRYKPDKMPIGIHYNESRNFTQNIIDLKLNDTIYIFTDGYVDQFGEDENKKFLSKNFKNLLLSIQTYSMEEQKEVLEKTLEEWRGRRNQVDDVLVIGVKII